MTLCDEKQLAERLNCTVSALRRWRREGRGPRFVKIGRLVRYRQEDIEDFIDQNTVDLRVTKSELQGGNHAVA